MLVISPPHNSTSAISYRYWSPTSHQKEASVPSISLWLTSSSCKTSVCSAPGRSAILILFLGLFLRFLPFLFQPQEVAGPWRAALCPTLCSHLSLAISAMLKVSSLCIHVHGSKISVSSSNFSQNSHTDLPMLSGYHVNPGNSKGTTK